MLWHEVDLDLGVLRVTSTLIRVTGRGLVRKGTKTQAGEQVLQLPEWCVILLDKRRAVGVGADEPVFGTMNGTSVIVTFHAWRKTTATVLDEAVQRRA